MDFFLASVQIEIPEIDFASQASCALGIEFNRPQLLFHNHKPFNIGLQPAFVNNEIKPGHHFISVNILAALQC